MLSIGDIMIDVPAHKVTRDNALISLKTLQYMVYLGRP